MSAPINQRLDNIEEWIGALIDVIGPADVLERMTIRAAEREAKAKSQTDQPSTEAVADGSEAA
jgi:hypothetical protein